MANSWFRMYSDTLGDPRLMFLPHAHVGGYFLLLALKSDGGLDQDIPVDRPDDYVALRLRISHKQALALKERLMEVRLIDSGLKRLKAVLERVPLLQVLDAIETVEKHLETDEEGKLTSESVNVAWSKVSPIAKALCKPETERQLLYIRGICRNRFAYCDEKRCLNLLKHAHEIDIDTDELTDIAKAERNWTNWRDEMLRRIDEMER